MTIEENKLFKYKKLTFQDLDVKNLFVIGSYHGENSRQKISMHRHENILEICFFDTGFQTYIVENKTYQICGGEVLITKPNETHGTEPFFQGKGIIYWVQFEMTMINRSFLTFQNEDAEEFVKKLLDIKERHFAIDNSFKKLLDKLLAIGQEPKCAIQRIQLYTFATQILLMILKASKANLQKAAQSKEILMAISYINNNLDHLIYLEELADHVHMAPIYFVSKFKEEVGTSPLDYVQRQRINKSKKLLSETNLNITEIAYSLAFPNSQYFSTIFKKYTSMTPTEFKKLQNK